MTNRFNLPTPLEVAHKSIIMSAAARATYQAHPDLSDNMRHVNSVALTAAHYAVEMMRELHKDSEAMMARKYELEIEIGNLKLPAVFTKEQPDDR